ncbi:MAG: UvrABC system protein B [Candidatus Yanofskybacteria bacterium GW2011_GWA1_48_10]|uniref:UvrABC system protein B n=2 Tax=Candidatus Yanofskyibacteriota TaxID=1752733 RepID=A0A0G1U7G1_9BACT|nr:MAG: UvrABC system protein B [Candidatus Yanofskybacteria bacterium GW2011_GWA1_48_10]OGN05968.1 MAG: excinuclease ABC subunit B [Candidatus Yanofskybacteria bacterium RIFCSPHIGHO2_01_FULL_48_25b]
MFKLISKFEPTGDQPQAIAKLAKGLKTGQKRQVLLGVTGSGKTFTMAKVIEKYQKPTLIISHNKTLAAQLYKEMREFFPHNAVHYFVSYYDYYQPEAYIPHTDTYIEKDSKINEELDRLRHAATQALVSRDDVIIVASVSCIYNLGSPEDYKNLGLELFEGKKIKPSELVRNLIRLQYTQDIELKRGSFRKTQNEIEITSPTSQEVVKICFKNDLSSAGPDRASFISRMYRAVLENPEDLETKDLEYQKIIQAIIFPAKYWVTTDNKISLAIENIKSELQRHIKYLKKIGKLQEAARLQEKTTHDIEMMRRTGYCNGIENYSRHLDFRKPGEPPFSMLDYFKAKGEFLTIIDESHITLPQLKSMYRGDHSRKTTLVNYGFRLPSAIDNRPLKFPEFVKRTQKVICVSATPSQYELKEAGPENVVEQFIRPTGLLDPTIEIIPTANQIEHLIERIKERIASKERVIVTTLTKRMAEDLSEHLAAKGIKVNYLHSEIKTLDRLKIIKDLRLGHHDVIVGVNLLREGLDLPEVSLIAILDADKEGFLRNATTLIQTMGRAARHSKGHVLMYADKITKSMQAAIDETVRRRKKQEAHNTKYGITPTTIEKTISNFGLPSGRKPEQRYGSGENEIIFYGSGSRQKALKQLQRMLDQAIGKFNYEQAMSIKEQMRKLRSQ